MKHCRLLSFILFLCVSAAFSAHYSSQQVNMIKTGLLSRLGLSELPHASLPVLPVPDHLWDIYDDVIAEDTIADSITHYYPQELLDMNSGLLLSFNLSRSVHNEQQQEAELRIRLQTTKFHSRVRVFHVIQDNDGMTHHRLLDSKSIDLLPLRMSNWIELDVSEALSKRRRRKQSQMVILYVEMDDAVTLYIPSSESLSTISSARIQSTSLVVYSSLSEPSRVRRKRNIRTGGGRKKGRKEHHRIAPQHDEPCHKRSLYIDFQELKWDDWIVAPKGYDAGQCMGSCTYPLSQHMNGTNHSILQSLLHSINPSSVPPPSCVTAETSSLVILFRNADHKIEIKTYKDMRVESCGCR